MFLSIDRHPSSVLIDDSAALPPYVLTFEGAHHVVNGGPTGSRMLVWLTDDDMDKLYSSIVRSLAKELTESPPAPYRKP